MLRSPVVAFNSPVFHAAQKAPRYWLFQFALQKFICDEKSADRVAHVAAARG
jgi:hypothetical protein